MLAVTPNAVYSQDWVDLSGQLMPQQRLTALHDALANGEIASVAALQAELERIHQCYAEDEWAWIHHAYEQVFGVKLASLTTEDLKEASAALLKVKSKFLNLVAADADKEFGEMSQMGFGQDGNAEAVAQDFRAVRGQYEENQFVKDTRQSVVQLQSRVESLNQTLDA